MSLDAFSQILIQQTKTNTASGASDAVTKEEMSLAKKIEEYQILLGNNTAHISAVVVQLLTLGKVRLDFREYTERLHLINKANMMDRMTAVPLVEAFLASLKSGETSAAGVDYTQKIIIQAPKRSVIS